MLSAAALIRSGIRGLPLVAYGWWAAVGIILTFIDQAVQRLPARISYAAAGGLTAVLLLDALHTHDWQPVTRSVLGALLATAILAGCALALPTLVHWGDVRYALAVGAAATWAGWLTLYLAALLATLSAALIGIGLILTNRVSRTTQFAQAPFWYGGTLLALLLLRG